MYGYFNIWEAIPLNTLYKNQIGELIKLELTNKKQFYGTLIDIGSDIIVFHNNYDFIYIPMLHIKNVRLLTKEEEESISKPESIVDMPFEEELSLRKILNSAKGLFTEIYVTGNQPIHGYITGVMNNYISFYSPVFKTILISLQHIKWLIPYSANERPYGLGNEDLPVHPSNVSLARTFEVQIEKMIGKLVVFNVGENESLIGKILNVDNKFIELMIARENKICLNHTHIKTIHFT